VSMRDVLGKFVFAAVMLTALLPVFHWGFVVIGVGLILFVPHWWVWLVGAGLIAVGLIARKLGKEFKI
jgi:hypothetical protein